MWAGAAVGRGRGSQTCDTTPRPEGRRVAVPLLEVAGARAPGRGVRYWTTATRFEASFPLWEMRTK